MLRLDPLGSWHSLLRKATTSRTTQVWISLRSYAAALPPAPARLKDEVDHLRAAEWVKAFEVAGTEAIPEDAYSIMMSRSSGPGGQVYIDDRVCSFALNESL